ncbi:MAG: hypothetical protein KME67_01775 [Candidatus Thiodiazotropha sp. (ex Codakia orbicularis)]|nr:hypothetical protein [Candidatus Thiodiazotropha sp. (ex Codakia orbicularis)]
MKHQYPTKKTGLGPVGELLERARQRIASLELLISGSTLFLDRMPLLRVFRRQVTAEVSMLSEGIDITLGFLVEFKTPYLHLPVEIDKTQVGSEDNQLGFRPASFRFFDWQSWEHMTGEISWLRERQVGISGKTHDFVSGFEYRVAAVPTASDNLGIRLAEGIDGTARVLVNRDIRQMKFEPVYWMLERGSDGYHIVAINSNELMVLIVSLSEIGSGNEQIYEKMIARLTDWVRFRFKGKSQEHTMLAFLVYVRDWGPLGMEPLYRGIKDVLTRLDITGAERILFDFYADNWGLRDNRHGRLLVIKTLEVLETQDAHRALEAISAHTQSQNIPPEESQLIRNAIRTYKEKA